MLLTGGNRNDVTQLLPLLHAIPPIRGTRGRSRNKPPKVYADRGYGPCGDTVVTAAYRPDSAGRPIQ